jgi:elongation factor Ts
MAEITAQLIKDLRERTGAGMADCKKALTETQGDLDKASDFLRKKGLAAAAKKAGRIATEGQVVSYIHSNGRIGVLLEVNCETDFVAKTDDFRNFCKDLAMQIAASNPLYVTEDEIPAALVDKEREIKSEQARNPKQQPGGPKPKVIPEERIPMVVDGQIAKWKKEICLMDQIFVKDEAGKKDIKALLHELVAKLGENIKVRRFVRFELGEGLEKKKDDFAAEVAKQAGLS